MQPKLSPKVLLLTSGLPFLAGLLCDGVLCLTDLTNSLFSTNKDPQGLESLRNPLLGFIKQAKDLSYGVYSSFMYFFAVMLIIHLIIQILKVSIHREVPRKAKRGNSLILNLLGYALAYTALYFFYTILLRTQVGKASSVEVLQDFEQLRENESFTREMKIIESPPSRMLEEISNFIEVKEGKVMKTFSLGKVLGSVSIDATSAVFSPDETLLFISGANSFGISVIDISNWENPRVIQDKRLMIIFGRKPPKASLLLSPDGKALFASNMQEFAKFPLDNLSSKKNLLLQQNMTIPSNSSYTDFEPSLALSADGTRLFASGYGFEMYDVSEKGANPKLIELEQPKGGSYFSTVAVSTDGQSLFLINGTFLDIYDITDIDHKRLISSFESENMLPCSFVQSKDGKILTLIGFEKGTRNVVLEKVDISDIRAPLWMKTIPLNIKSYSSVFGFNQSPKETYLYFTVKEENSKERKMIIFDTFTERLLEDNQNLISKAKSILFTSNENNMVAIYEESVLTLQLYKNYPNDRIFSISKETFAQVSTVPSSLNKILKEFSSSNRKFLLSVDERNDLTGSRFTFIDISNPSSPVEINSFSAGANLISVSITNDGKILSVSFKSSIVLYDISDLKSINIIGSKTFHEPSEVIDAVFTSDGKTCFAAVSANGTSQPKQIKFAFDLKVLDLSDPGSIKEIDSFYRHFFSNTPPKKLLTLSQDDKTLFLVTYGLDIWNVSARKVSSNFLGGRNFTFGDESLVPSSISLSPDGKILIFKKEYLQSSCLYFYNVSNPASPKLIGVFPLPKTKIMKGIPVGFSADGKFAYAEGIHGGRPSLLVLNISNPISPIFQSVIQAEGFTEGSVDNFIISDDGKTVYLASNVANQIYIANLDTPNTVFLGTESFRLGEKSQTDVMVLRQNSHGDYALLGKNYRFVKASFFSTKIVTSENSTEPTFTPFPYWTTFEKKTGSLAIEPRKQRDLGNYILYSVFSTQLNHSSWKSISNDTSQVLALLGSLVSLDYLDNQLYVTENFGTFDHFYYTGSDREKVYQILKESCFETFTMFDIVPSLDIIVNSEKKLEVQTPSDNSLKIEITLMDKSFQFLSKQYGPLMPLITEDKTKLAIEGSIDDVNEALKKLAVNSELDDTVCEGTITIWDRLNPSLTKTLKNLSSYFVVNEAPMINLEKGFALQEQINSKVYETGKEFSLPLLKNTFIDKHSAENLRFMLTLNNTERSSVSDWLTFNDGVLKGTPKKEVLHRSINLILTVSNEFKKVEVSFTMDVKLSSMFILELLMKYSPYILTVVSLWIFANRIYNVLKKGKYRHHTDFYISVGQEITSQDIYPISFIGQEALESDLIWKQISKKKGMDKSQIIGEIKAIVKKIPEKSLYKKGSAVSKKLIHQLIMNNMALWLIDREEEKETKRVFEKDIQSELMDLVLWDEKTGYCQINEDKFAEILKKSLRDEREEGLESILMNKAVVNVDLLKDVVIAEAMKLQSVQTKALFTHLIIKEEVPANWIFRFLKRNLYDLQSVQGQKMAYGIDFEIKNGVLCFSGTAEEIFCGKTIIVQIVDLRYKILKEVWIHGVGNSEEQFDYDSDGEDGTLKNNYEIL